METIICTNKKEEKAFYKKNNPGFVFVPGRTFDKDPRAIKFTKIDGNWKAERI